MEKWPGVWLYIRGELYTIKKPSVEGLVFNGAGLSNILHV